MNTGPVLVRRRVAGAFDAAVQPGGAGLPARILGRVLAPVTSVHRAASSPPVVALTWDDGPHPVHTPGVLDALSTAGARATFFVLVTEAERHPDLIHRMVAEGHEIGLHGVDHRRLSAVPGRSAARLVREGRSRLQDVVGKPVTLFRPPYGAQTLGQVARVNASGLTTVIWSTWIEDWEDVDAQVLVDRGLGRLVAGDVVLLHDAYGVPPGGAQGGHEPSFDRAAVARALLDGLERRGLGQVTVSELLTNPHQTSVWVERPPRA